MADFDAIVVGAGHNGLTAAALLQKAGLRTLCLDFKLYAGGMASTVELFDGYKFEIAGSVQIPTSAVVSRELGLDELPTVELDVMSVSLRGVGDEPLVYYTDPMKLLTHINEVHGAEAVNGMAGLMAWCQAPTRALGRFEAGTPPKTLDEMYACATNEFERSTITDLLFGSVTDVIDRYLPDQREARCAAWHAVAAGVQHHVPRTRDAGHRCGAGLRVRRAGRKRAAGQEVAGRHRRADDTPAGPVHVGRWRAAAAQQGRRDPGRRRPRQRGTPRGRLDADRADRRVRRRPRPHDDQAGRLGRRTRRHQGTIRPRRPPRQLLADALRPRWHTRVRGALRTAQRSRNAVQHRHFQHTRRAAAAVGGLPPRHRPR